LINDILDLSTLDSGNYKLVFNDADLNVLCMQTLESVKGREASGVSLCFDAPSPSLSLSTDVSRTRQLLTNYLTNACKYTSKGSIVLTYEKQDDYIVFSVTDTGKGVNPAYADKIFERFEKIGSIVQGTGLGLNICQRIAHLMNGKVMLDTSYTQGARFLFYHPIHISETNQTDEANK
jgi:signal transduction histidine kinase